MRKKISTLDSLVISHDLFIVFISGSRPYSSRFGTTTTAADSASKGVSAIASKFGETKTPSTSRGVTSPTTTTYTPTSTTPSAYGRSRLTDTTIKTNTPAAGRTRDSTNSLDTTARTRTRGDTSADTIPGRRTRESTTTDPETPQRRTRDKPTESTISYASTTFPRTRSRENGASTNTTFESPSTYTPKCKQNAYDKIDTGTGYASDAKSGYGSDYRSGYTSGSKYQPYSRNNSTLKDAEPSYKTSYSRENSTYKPYSRENSYMGSDAGGSSWRSRVYGTENDNSTASPNLTENIVKENDVKNGSLDTTVFRDAIDKLSKAAKDESSEAKKPDGVSPNAVRVLPIFSPGELNLKNKAPADFTSASEGSGAEEGNENTTSKTEKCSSNIIEKKEDVSPVSTPGRAFRHLAAVTPLPSRASAVTAGLAQPPSFKHSTRYANKDTEALPTGMQSKWLRERDDSKPSENLTDSPSPTINRSGAGNKDCRKSVLNMDINPVEKELMRKQQEEKREELRRLRRQRGDDPKTSILGKPPKQEDSGALRVRPTDQLEISNVLDEDEQQSSDESKSEKPPVPPSVEKTNSRTRLVERKHSKGKGDGVRQSGSIRRIRDRQSSQNSKSSSSSSSSEEESENRLPKSRNSSFSRRRKGSRDDIVGSSGDSRPSSRIRTESSQSRRSRTNSENLCKTSSKNNLLKSRSGNNSRSSLVDGDKSRNNSKSSLISETKLSLGPEIDIGESTYTFTIGKKSSKPSIQSPSAGSITRTKPKKQDASSSEDESSKSTESSESGSEEGQFFSLAKSKSMKKSRSSIHKMPTVQKIDDDKALIEELGVRTSPDGKEYISRNNSNANMKSYQCENEDEGTVTAKVTITLPKKNILQESLSTKSVRNDLAVSNTTESISRSSSNNIICNASTDENYGEFQWPTGSPELPRKKIEAAIASQNGYDEFKWPSESPDLHKKNVEDTPAENGYGVFQWPSGSPEVTRRKITPTVAETNGYEEFTWPSGSPELSRKQTITADTVYDNGFQWPDGSPEMPRKKPSYLRTQWDTETETEMTELEQTEWSDGSPKSNRRLMPQVEEETEEEEFNFEWPSSPEMSRRHPYATQNSGYDTQNEIDNFEWGSSPELPAFKDHRYVTMTQNIDELIDEEKLEDNFDKLEKLYGFETPAEETDKTESTRTSRRSSKCSEKALTDGMTDDNKEDEEEEQDEENDQNADDDKLESGLQSSTKDDEKKQSKESLKDRARNNLSVFLGKSLLTLIHTSQSGSLLFYYIIIYLTSIV